MHNLSPRCILSPPLFVACPPRPPPRVAYPPPTRVRMATHSPPPWTPTKVASRAAHTSGSSPSLVAYPPPVAIHLHASGAAQ
jgi:hypothetical protein